MNRSFHNIGSKWLGGLYDKYRVGYDADGNVWHIRKFRNRGSSYHYACSRADNQSWDRFTRDTIAEISDELEKRGKS